MTKTPITIFSGYLGSGKTTIILNALNQYREPRQFAMIKNEFGDASVDGSLAKLQNLAVTELVNGCLCCILVGSLNDAVDELIEKQHPERIIIEASGNALPFPILLELKKNPHVYVDGVISVVDCVNFERVKDTSIVAREQAKHTDLIVFNKTDLVDEEKLYRVKEEIYGINPDTAKIETDNGIIDPAILFGIEHIEEPITDDHHEHDHHMETFAVDLPTAINQQKMTEVLHACKQTNFYRIKGIVMCDDGVTRLVNGVFGRLTWTDLSESVPEHKIIFIGNDILRFETMVRDYMEKTYVIS